MIHLAFVFFLVAVPVDIYFPGIMSTSSPRRALVRPCRGDSIKWNLLEYT